MLTFPDVCELRLKFNLHIFADQKFHQEYWFGTFGKAQGHRFRLIIAPLTMRHLNAVLLAGR